MRAYPTLRPAVILLFTTAFLGFPPPCRAGLLFLEPDPSGPALLTLPGDVTYAGGNFNTTALPLSLSGGGVPGGLALFSGGTATVDLFVDPSGTFVANGLGFLLEGSIDLDSDGFDDASGPLLVGDIVAFGADPAGPPTRAFNGVFLITGGALTGPVGLTGGGTATVGFQLGRQGGFLVSAEDVFGGTLGDFTADFSGAGKLEAFALVPEPSSAALAGLAAGLAGLWASRRRKPAPPR